MSPRRPQTLAERRARVRKPVLNRPFSKQPQAADGVALTPAQRAALIDTVQHGCLLREGRAWAPPVPVGWSNYREHDARAVSALARAVLVVSDGIAVRATPEGEAWAMRNEGVSFDG